MTGDNYMKPALAQVQWAVASKQIVDLKEGNPHRLFKSFGVLLKSIDPDHGKRDTAPAISLLDVCCGCGYYSEIIEHYRPGVFRYQGCDFNPGMITKAKELWPERDFSIQDARRLQFSSRSFDAVMSGACIAHIEQWEQALKELCRVSRHWFLLHRSPIQPHDEETTLKTRLYGGEQVWIRRFKRSDLHDLVQAQGFSLAQSVISGTNLESYLYERTTDD